MKHSKNKRKADKKKTEKTSNINKKKE